MNDEQREYHELVAQMDQLTQATKELWDELTLQEQEEFRRRKDELRRRSDTVSKAMAMVLSMFTCGRARRDAARRLGIENSES